MRRAARWEARTTKRYEASAMRAVDAVIAISRGDARAFRSLSGCEAIVVPPFVAAQPPRVERTARPALAYIGALAWQPNAQGLDWFCAQVWPRVRAKIPDATLTIAGPGLQRGSDGSLILPDAWRQPGVSAAGFVEKLAELYDGTVALIAPILGGSGVRMKLLEAMSAGMPTVTTSDGAAGLDVVDDREMLVADDPAAFADRVVRVLHDPALRARLRDAGYAYLAAHHAEGASRARVERALGIALASDQVAAVPAALSGAWPK
jgi:glycosyltransferase involved in cell wall biosynthesis